MQRRKGSSSARRRTPGSTRARRRASAASTRSIPTRSCWGSRSTTRSARSICRRSGISACRKGMSLHWDGNNDSVEERNKSAAIGAGATPKSLDLASLARIEEWLLDFRPPPFPPARVDKSLAATGAGIYKQACASCHATDGANVGKVTDIADIKTDPGRLESFTADLAVKMNTVGEGRPWRFSHFKKTNGYANMPLDGLWLRAPYLHNGSVPDLRSLLFLERTATRVLPRVRRLRLVPRRVHQQRSPGRVRGRSFRHDSERERQRGPSLRHDAFGCRPPRPHRVLEDAVT